MPTQLLTQAHLNEALPYRYKSHPYLHQHQGFMRSRDMQIFAFLFEQGAGKSKPTVDTAAYLHSKGRIDSVVIIAPNGVHRKWVKEDFPLSFPDYQEYKAEYWDTSSAKQIQKCEDLLEPGSQLRVLCMNVEGFVSKKSQDMLKRFLKATDCLLVIDESTRIKNPDAKRTEFITKMGDYAKYKRILTGDYITNNPFDAYAQFNFLDTSIFGCSFFAFKAQYAEILDKNDILVQRIMQKSGARFAPQIVATDKATGRPKYKNLDKLKAIIEPYSMRVEKKDCLDLPDKIFETRYFKMAPRQQKIYNELKQKQKSEMGESKLTVLHKMTLQLRLQQVANGFFPADEEPTQNIFTDPKENPRIALFLETVEDIQGSIIVWCRFKEEIRQLMRLLGDDAVAYYGDVNKNQREINKELFQSGQKKFFIGTAAAGGIGLNLTAASTVIYYSNTFSYEDRKQSEDRAHRIGQVNNVLYIDFQAEDSVDAKIVGALRSKKDLAEFMNNFEEEIAAEV